MGRDSSLFLKRIGFGLLLPEILINFRVMREVVSNTRVNVAKAQRRKALDDLLGCRAKFEMMDDAVQTNSRTSDANCPLLGDHKGHADRLFQ